MIEAMNVPQFMFAVAGTAVFAMLAICALFARLLP